MTQKRHVQLAVISDVHLGTFGCHAKELLQYLNCIQPKTLILNGDIIDIWQFRKNYFPKSHLKIIQKIISLSASGTEVIYLTGNHDEMLRKFSDIKIGNLSVVDKKVMDLDGKKAWFFHGDVFDVSIQQAKWLAKLGGWGYDLLILLNRFINFWLIKFKREKFSLSKKIKNSVKKAVKYVQDFENVASDLAIENGYKYVICGHIHQPQMVRKVNHEGTCLYLNSGDWVENLTALEYHDKKWNLIKFDELHLKTNIEQSSDEGTSDLLTAITIISKLKG
ncbi:UDP-2,3-diacylglucosamine diphosphatase [Mesohalobacter halotolerans]|uniref:UDP-2,3-diacylglucosamine diphosphatase n=1 Tax=Mesohalobacter halotolerans TaxID=1883405 RepID=A0A4U5TQV3_9FLAO|nr:UDP-2,3-diacylglucosamine diphosphatase [Mesohalobacter halotolerans]MBS3737666.1 UDP-2,3-diacylglucosamine diphosphatase [Psychroflexus sp.]TKS56599.1 UDP-2,3-diacylglucosamine diphosphatase [Mesohalobacter halotolerans]